MKGLIRTTQSDDGHTRITWNGSTAFVLNSVPSKDGLPLKTAQWLAPGHKPFELLRGQAMSAVAGEDADEKLGEPPPPARPPAQSEPTRSAAVEHAEGKSWASIVRGNKRQQPADAHAGRDVGREIGRDIGRDRGRDIGILSTPGHSHVQLQPTCEPDRGAVMDSSPLLATMDLPTLSPDYLSTAGSCGMVPGGLHSTRPMASLPEAFDAACCPDGRPQFGMPPRLPDQGLPPPGDAMMRMPVAPVAPRPMLQMLGPCNDMLLDGFQRHDARGVAAVPLGFQPAPMAMGFAPNATGSRAQFPPPAMVDPRIGHPDHRAAPAPGTTLPPPWPATVSGQPSQPSAAVMAPMPTGLAPSPGPFHAVPAPPVAGMWAGTTAVPGSFPGASIGYPVAPPAPPVPSLHDQLRNQIEYYFSDENLDRDMYLRHQMSSEGFVPLITLSGFARVRQLTPLNDGGTGSIGLLVQVLMQSQHLEVDSTSTKVRRRRGWEKYLITG